jgi:hypothetical protein
MIWNSRREYDDMSRRLAEDLSNHKLEVARNYASIDDLRILENRITSHLMRIEAKLDVTALKTESVHSKTIK